MSDRKKPTKQPEAPKEDVEFILDIDQRSPEWYALRLGMPTASRFSTILASGRAGGKSETRDKLLNQLAGEILTGEPCETFSNAAMARGNEMEAEAREFYARTRFAELTSVGFVRRTVRKPLGTSFVVGASPDSQVGKDGGLEIKTMRPDMLIPLAKRGAGGFPPEHRAQCQGTLWVTGWAWLDLMVFYRGMPVAPTFRVIRDEAYIARIAEETERFDFELRRLVEEMRSLGRVVGLHEVR